MCPLFLHVIRENVYQPRDEHHVAIDRYIHVILRLKCSEIKLSQFIVGHLSSLYIYI